MTPDAAFDARAFRNALGCFATGITVISTLGPDGAPIGVTMNSFSSVSLDPPLVQFCLARSSTAFHDIVAAPTFVVNILSEEQVDLSVRFSQRGLLNRWAGLEVEHWDTGVPVLPGCLANLECDHEAVFEGGDHVIILGRVRRIASREGRPLLYYQGAYARLD
jgi:flavin reductase (DIM6/NTAB) family NADH-FMN oxidoreductase RutF